MTGLRSLITGMIVVSYSVTQGYSNLITARSKRQEPHQGVLTMTARPIFFELV